ncbi:MAG: sugar phosphate isomerase/epimerase [Chloroflexota bacterium]|nr:sugar phosphate isomerase/epimerase [Chloroflexota bacterium]
MTVVSFMSANLVARELGYRMPDWGAGDRATRAAFAPIETFEQKFDELLGIAHGLGFDVVDIWEAHLDPGNATGRHLETAVRLLRERGMRVASLAGWFGSTRERFAAACRVAVAVGAPVLGGGTKVIDTDRDWAVSELERHDLRLGFENHPEKPAEMLAKIGDGAGGRIGTTVDTGWYGTQGVDAGAAIERLAPHVFHVHLKDVRHAGLPHETCAYGEGVVPLRECVAALRRIGYSGAISIEHEPDEGDPLPAIGAAHEQLQHWLAEEGLAA